VKDERKYGENEQHMNQAARDMKHQESATPGKEKQKRD
jgi:hypothetical protein